MQEIRARLTGFTLRRRSLRISHVDCGLIRCLEGGEHVVLHDPETGIHHTAAVAEIEFGHEDTTYRLELGTRITSAEAEERVREPSELPADRVTTRDIAALLGELRRGERHLSGLFSELP